MSDSNVICIQPTRRLVSNDTLINQLRVASYSRVSTDDEEQLSSFESQKEYYTNLISSKPEWRLVGTYADEGISGASAKKRPGFQNMIRQCKKGKIDLIITKSISRFARNTVDSINYVRLLKSIGIGVIFEKENINTLEENSEFLLTMLSSMAQEELNSISQNVKMGKRMAMKQGKFRHTNIYGYRLINDDGVKKYEIIEDEARTVNLIYSLYINGMSEGKIAKELNNRRIEAYGKENIWKTNKIDTILKNERYSGDVLLQKTYVSDPISKKVIRNKGEVTQYLIKDVIPVIVNKEIFNKAQEERANRNNIKTINKDFEEDIGKYSGKYALTQILVCGECLSPYQRKVWTKRNGEKMAVWRCSNRLVNGTKYCKSSSSIDEESLQKAIMEAINKFRGSKSTILPIFINELKNEAQRNTSKIDIMELESKAQVLKQDVMELIGECIENGNLDENEEKLKKMNEKIKSLTDTIEKCKSQNSLEFGSIDSLERVLKNEAIKEDEYNDVLVRKLISAIKVVGDNKLVIIFKNGEIYEQYIEANIKRQKNA